MDQNKGRGEDRDPFSKTRNSWGEQGHFRFLAIFWWKPGSGVNFLASWGSTNIKAQVPGTRRHANRKLHSKMADLKGITSSCSICLLLPSSLRLWLEWRVLRRSPWSSLVTPVIKPFMFSSKFNQCLMLRSYSLGFVHPAIVAFPAASLGHLFFWYKKV